MTSSRLYNDSELDDQYNQWLQNSDKSSTIDTDKITDLVRNSLNRLNGMTVQEYILWQKWEEINRKYPSTVGGLFNESTLVNADQATVIQKAKGLLWKPWDPNGFEDIRPELVFTHEQKYDDINELWTTTRVFTSTMIHSGHGIGRAMSFLVRDRVTQLTLGVITISGDFLDLTARDKKIGWTRKQRTDEQRIQYTAIGSSIVPTQPLGYMYLGGKLLAMLCCSDVVQTKWKELYGKPLVGLTTTSLYGNAKNHGLSQYDGLKPYWKRMGFSKGSVAYQLPRDVRASMREWMSQEHPRKYWEYLVATDRDGKPLKRDSVNRSAQYCYRQLGIKNEEFQSYHERGIYFSRFYQNTDEFLRDDISESELQPSVWDPTVESITQRWKEKYAKKRLNSLISQNRDNYDTLYYDDMVGSDWETAREKYLKNVGR